MVIGNRIKELRKKLNLTQAEFGEKIGLKPTAIGQMENGSRNVTERTIILLCEKYNVDELWLRTGEGDMNSSPPPEDEIMAAVNEVLLDVHCENSFYTIIKEILIQHERMDEASRKQIDSFFDDVLKGIIEKKEGK